MTLVHIRMLAGLGMLVFAAVVIGLTLGVQHVLLQYVLPARSQEAFAKLANVPRRHLESVKSWERRTVAAYKARDEAQERFIEAAEWRATGPRSGEYILSVRHPASVALLRAKYPDGPPFEKLAELAGLESEHDRFGVGDYWSAKRAS